jgi:uncharacterized membrane protein
MNNQEIPPLQEIRARRKPIRNVNIEHREKLSGLEKLAVFITNRVGTMGFFLLVFFWTIFWLAWNIFAPKEWQFDPLPQFAIWLFISNMLQLLFLPLLMVGQNLQNKHAEARAEADFEVNIQAEKEIEIILHRLEEQSVLLEDIKKQLEENKLGN